MTIRYLRLVAGLVLAACVAGLAERRGSLSRSGALASTLVGALAFTNGWTATRALLVFFITSSALSHFARAGLLIAPRRSAVQVLANGGVASSAWALQLFGCPGNLERLAIGSLAAAAADTWATEIGQRWGGTPRLITSGHRVGAGESGGVTAAGTLGAVAGALSVAASIVDRGDLGHVTAAGLLGSLIDSVLGATLQARYTCQVCGAGTEQSEHCDRTAKLRTGRAWMSNNTVNAVATLCGGIAYAGWPARR